MIKLASRNECTGCMACVDSCNHQAISMTLGKDGHYYPVIKAQSCVECGLCVQTCPVVNRFEYKKETKDSIPYAAWNTNMEQRMKSTSGGVFSAIATTVLAKGGVVFGVAIKDSQAYHVCIDDIKDLHLIQGSKYQQSYSAGIYKKVKEQLLANKLVLFSGTACQVAGLLSYLGKQYDNLITIDLICGGIPSRLPIEKYLKETGDTEIIGYRDKIDNYEKCHLQTVSNSIIKRDPTLNELIIKSFLGCYTDRASCLDCKFNGFHRKSDLTVADFWGDRKYTEQHSMGLSVMITHTQKGENIATESALEIHKSSFEEIVSKNPRLIYGKTFGARIRLHRLIMTYAFRHFSTNTILALYCGTYKSRLWLPVKIFRFFIWKTGQMIKRNKIKKALNSQI